MEIKRIVVVGNGFDINHGLNTRYSDFVNYCKNINQDLIEKYDDLVRSCSELAKITNADTWYNFEYTFEIITREVFEKSVLDFNDDRIGIVNQIFKELENLLFDYIEKEYKRCKEIQGIEIKSSIRKYVNDETLFISFNYTDTVKLYTDCYYYVHGSVNDDKHIILGFADGETFCLQNGLYSRYVKEERKQLLDFVRYASTKEVEIDDDLISEMQAHVDSLFSGRGEYDLPSGSDCGYDTSVMSNIIKEYAKDNNFELSKDKYDYASANEIIVIGHGLESDLRYLEGIFGSSRVNRIVLFSYEGEPEEEIIRKKEVLHSLTRELSIGEIDIDWY